MNFLVDAQLPRRLAYRLRDTGYDALHTLDLPEGNHTTDPEINTVSERENRVVVTKDEDFVDSFYVSGRPYKLLLISLGNVTNAELESILVPQIPEIAAALKENDYVEITRTALIVHA